MFDPIIKIIRVENNPHYGTIGMMVLHGELFCSTLEPPFYDNMQNISCIPEGQYQCSKKNSPKYGQTYEVRHVPNRSNILFHAGNLVADTQGCILLGQYPGKLRGNRAILNSGDTFLRFMSVLAGVDTFSLTIVSNF